MAAVRETASESHAINAAMERLKNKRKREDSCDLISSLPDSILLSILGLLKTKQAVQTCVLSKRWEYLWTSLPSLYFDSADFCYRKYVDFVNAVLLRRKPLPLDEFRLFDNIVWDESFDLQFSDSSPDIVMYVTQVGDWIQYAMKHKTRVLHLPGYLLPTSYPYTSLDELYLHGYARIVAGTVDLLRLRKLTIYNGELIPDDLKEILSGCPILEYLSLDNCYGEVVIKHECLKHLAVVNCRVPWITKSKLSVSAPNLLSFFYDNELPYSGLHKTTLNVPSLTSACLMMRHSSTSNCLRAVASILPFLANIQCLELYIQCFWHKLTYAERGASSISSRVSVSSCKNLERNEVKQSSSYWMIGRSVDAFLDDTKDLYTLFFNHNPRPL